jgi:hypothetical protein
MNRRQFVSRVSLGAAAACTTFAKPSLAAASNANLTLRFVGLMGFIERMDRSFLVATPGQSHHMMHVPFLMARAGSRIADSLGFTRVPGVVPAAFDTALIGTRPEAFVFRSLQNTSLDVVSGDRDAVKNEAFQMAQMNKIAPGKRVRGNIEKWASSTVSLRGGRLENSSAHPDAGKIWTFGDYSQRVTDAVNFKNTVGDPTTIRLTGATEAQSYRVGSDEAVDLWAFSAATFSARSGSPKRLVHSELLFDYLVDAKPVLPECPDAAGRDVPDTAMPFVNPSSASLGGAAGGTFLPPDSELCILACYLLEPLGQK